MLFRPAGNDQLSGFQVYGQMTTSGPEFLLYTNPPSEPFGDGVFDISFTPTVLATVIVRRNDIITLCEVDVFGGMYYVCICLPIKVIQP